MNTNTQQQPDTKDVQASLDRNKAYTRKLYAETQKLIADREQQTGEGTAPRRHEGFARIEALAKVLMYNSKLSHETVAFHATEILESLKRAEANLP